MDADQHAFCQTIFQGVEGPEWEAVYHHCKPASSGEKQDIENTKPKVLWAMKEAKDNGVSCYDANHQHEIQTRAQFRLDFWAIRLKSPTAALAKALACLEHGESAPSVTCGEVRSFGLSALLLPSGAESVKSAKCTRRVCEEFGKGPAGKGCGPFWAGTFQVSKGHSFSFS